MSLYTLPIRPTYPIITCRVSPATATTVASTPTPPSLLPPATSATAVPSLTCALQCPHFESCSGCTHEFNLHRPVIVDEASNFFKGLGVSDFTFDSCRLWGWRCRAKLAVRGSSENPLIGLYQEGTHNVVDIPQCKAHHPNINAAVELLRKGVRELNIEPYDEDQGTGDLRYVQMAVTTHNTALPAVERYRNGRVQVALVWNSRNEKSSNSDKLNALANFLWRNGGSRSKLHLVHSVWANFQTSTNNIIFGNRWRHLLGERDFWEHVGGIDISLDPSSFGQANTRVSEAVNLAEEKRPWVLRERERAKEASVQVGRETISEDPQSLPETLIYISCGWESFKEDCKSLLNSKFWQLEKAHGFNFFPGTQSIEVLAVFKRSLKKKKTGKKKKKQG
ncbi:putative RNA methyltransferase isoform X2 [Gossypium australe]|uniref:Putative RNA methyltransferase isoform X2 n=1 Tax=Gossypium australe TaxID=47621 RepID=A0A5B6WEE4_9ROSI|nr:putative RNA methyltransferase isoform X2 [Gossypium australe]